MLRNTTVVAAILIAFSAHAQSFRPQFEVATVKRNVTGNSPPSYQAQPGGRLLIGNAPFKLILALAYTVRDYQISGGPSWIATDQWELQAKAAEGSIPPGLGYPGPATPNHPLLLMLQSLLEDRFQLKMHREMREEPVYELTIAKNRSRMQVSHDQAAVEFPAVPTPDDPIPRGRIRTQGTRLEGSSIAIAQLVSVLSDIAKRPIINKTGLSGFYDFKLEWSPDLGANGLPLTSPDASGPSIFTALQEQLGLKLESARGPVEVLVIDSVAKATEN